MLGVVVGEDSLLRRVSSQTDKKMKKVKQATTKTTFLTLSGSKISIVVTATVPKDEGDYEVND